MKTQLMLLAPLCLLLSSCNPQEDLDEPVSLIQDAERDKECGIVECTTQYEMAIVHVVNAEGAPVDVAETDFKVYYTESKAAIAYDREMLSIGLNEIAIASDTYIKHIAFDGISITVEVNVEGFEPDRKEYIVGRDCCHILYPRESRFEFVLK